MSKIIIHNETSLDDKEAIEYLYQVYNELKKMTSLSYCEFEDKTRVQIYHQKTCDTFYIYGRWYRVIEKYFTLQYYTEIIGWIIAGIIILGLIIINIIEFIEDKIWERKNKEK